MTPPASRQTLERLAGLGAVVSASVLAVAGATKLVGAMGNAPILREADPIFGVANRSVFLGVGALEVWCAWIIMRTSGVQSKLVITAALATNFLLYRAGLLWLGVARPCPCLGNADAWIGLTAGTLDGAARMGLWWLAATSYLPLALLLWRGRATGAPQPASR